MKKVCILGGTSGFGEWLAKYALKHFAGKVEVTITGRNIEKGESVANKIGCKFSNNNIQTVVDSDIVIVSVPINVTLKTIEEITPHVKEGSILADVTSVKTIPSEAMYKLAKKGVIVIPTHPMFGPSISTIAGQVIVLTPNDEVKGNSNYKYFKEFLISRNAKIYEIDSDKHDSLMAVIQGLTHFTLLTMGKTIMRLGFDFDYSQNFISPIYKIMTASIGRYVGQEPGLYADIQMNNKEIEIIHNTFMEVAGDFNQMVKSKDRDGFISMVEKVNNYLGDRSEEGQKYTDKLIHLNAMQIRKLNNAIGKEITLENIYDGSIIFGQLRGIDNDSKIVLETGDKYDINERILI